MKVFTPENIERHLSEKINVPIFFIYGEERFFHDKVLQSIENHLFKNASEKSLNHHIFYGTESNESDILTSCLSYPMLADYKMVIIKEFDKLKINDKESFLKYINYPQPSTILVLLAGKISNTSFYNSIIKKSVSIRCNPLFENQIYTWVNNKFHDHKIKVNKECVKFIIENIGQNLLRINMEIEKIINYVGSDNEISINDVARLIGFSKDVNIFYFQKVLALKNLSSSLKTGLRLLEQGESMAAILPMLFYFFRRMWTVKQLLLKNYSKNKILDLLKGNQYLYSDIFATVNNFTDEQLENIIGILEESELQLKTSQRTSHSIITMLCFNICNAKK